MSFVKPDHSGEDALSMAALLEEQEQFCAEIADGLHTLAQPLTILRSAIAMLAVVQENGLESRRYIEMSARQIERTCGIFASVQNLLAAKMIPAEQEPVDVQQLLKQAVEDRLSELRERGISIVVEMEGLPSVAYGEAQRMKHAIAAAIDATVSISSHGDVIKVDSYVSEEFLEISFGGARRLDNGLKSIDRLNLSLARANMLSQQGRYLFTAEPFRISLALPVRQHDSEVSKNICAACADERQQLTYL